MEIEQIERTYSQYAGFYDLIFDHILQPGRRAAVRALAPQPGDRILEIGIGTGLSVPFYPLDCHITGIDLSAPMLREAEKKRATEYPLHALDLIEMDATKLEFPDGHFDRVLASYVLSTVPDEPGNHVRPERSRLKLLVVVRAVGEILFPGILAPVLVSNTIVPDIPFQSFVNPVNVRNRNNES